MPPRKAGQLSGRDKSENSVFLNVPYDAEFQRLFLGYVAGLHAFGMVPRTTLEIPGGVRRLDRVMQLIADCRYSIHDLSRVQLSRSKPRAPRFNMPFELGLAVAHSKWTRGHTFFVFEQNRQRLSKSLSDLDGTDPYIHDGTLSGLFAQLGNAFVRVGQQPEAEQIRAMYRELRSSLASILRASGSGTIFQARAFRDISTVASALAQQLVPK